MGFDTTGQDRTGQDRTGQDRTGLQLQQILAILPKPKRQITTQKKSAL